MGLLRDEDLLKNLSLANPDDRYVSDVVLPADQYSKDSPVQASSVELHIGAIYLPGVKESPAGSAQTKVDHVLRTGETAVITTRETLRLPANVAAFGFPPSGVSFKGLLMTNPGHVDPGYQGRLRFTVINMAKDPFPLNRGDRIVKLLFFSLDRDVHASWIQRNPNPNGNPDPTQSEVNRLSKDFVDLERRAKSIAKRQGVQWSVGITGAVALLAAIFQMISSGHLFPNRDIQDIKARQDVLEKRIDVDEKLTEFDNRISLLEKVTNQQSRKQPPGAGTKKGQSQTE